MESISTAGTGLSGPREDSLYRRERGVRYHRQRKGYQAISNWCSPQSLAVLAFDLS